MQVMSLVPRDRSISSFSFCPVDSQTWSQTAGSDSIRTLVSSKLALNWIEINSPRSPVASDLARTAVASGPHFSQLPHLVPPAVQI